MLAKLVIEASVLGLIIVISSLKWNFKALFVSQFNFFLDLKES